MWIEIWNVFREYSGNGLTMTLFGLSFVFLLLTEKERYKRIILLYISAVTLILFFCPLFAKFIFEYMDSEIYYRILWLLPMSVIIAYAGIKVVGGIAGRWKSITAGILVTVMIIVTGDYVYDNPFFSKAQNRFHVPQIVADVCDAIIVPGREVRAAFPSDFLPYVRQYTANICMPYGRDLVVDTWTEQNELYDAMVTSPADCEKIAELAAQQDCHYIIIHEQFERKGSFEGTEYYLKDTVDGFNIYLREGANLTLEYPE